MDLLGDSIEKIAVEKAGIIKSITPVVISETQIETENIFSAKAKEMNSLICFADREYECEFGEYSGKEKIRSFRMNRISANHLSTGTIPLPGDYQIKNLQAVYAAVEMLKGVFDIGEDLIVRGIRNVVTNTSFSGRWQVLSSSPLTICDTGHNKEGLEYVLGQLRRIPATGLHIVLGFVSDKDLASVLPLFPSDAIYYFTKAGVQRALNEEILRSEAAVFGLKGESFPEVKSALEAARKNASQSDLIFVGGSTFVVAEVV
jgi:dihydrofolate synthase/folylpolyglutamate synthase